MLPAPRCQLLTVPISCPRLLLSPSQPERGPYRWRLQQRKRQQTSSVSILNQRFCGNKQFELLMSVHVQGGDVSTAPVLLRRLRAAVFPRAPAAALQAAMPPPLAAGRGPERECFHKPKRFSHKNKNKKEKQHKHSAQHPHGRRYAELSRFCCETPSIAGVTRARFNDSSWLGCSGEV